MFTAEWLVKYKLKVSDTGEQNKNLPSKMLKEKTTEAMKILFIEDHVVCTSYLTTQSAVIFVRKSGLSNFGTPFTLRYDNKMAVSIF